MKYRIGVFSDGDHFVMDARSGYVFASGLKKEEANALHLYLSMELYKEKQAEAYIDDSLKKKEELPFGDIYALFPRKMGKASGIKWLKAHVKTQQKFNLVKKAAEAYAQWVKRSGVDEKYMLHFSTWVKRWEDWVPDTIVKTPEKVIAEKLFPLFGE